MFLVISKGVAFGKALKISFFFAYEYGIDMNGMDEIRSPNFMACGDFLLSFDIIGFPGLPGNSFFGFLDQIQNDPKSGSSQDADLGREPA